MTAEIFKLISLNVRGINNFQKRRTMFLWCRRKKAQIVFLQETHSKKEVETQWKNEWGGKIFFSHGSSNSAGVAILIKNGVDCTVNSVISDPSGRYLILRTEIEDKSYVLVNIYAPNKDKDLTIFFRNTQKLICDNNLDCEENIIIGGDFNCPLNPLLDKNGGVITPRKAVVESISCMQSELDLIDVWRIKNPRTKSYTWSQKSPCIFCRLDYWLISNNLQDFVKSTNIIPAIKADHAAIDLIISDIEKGAKGPGFWKFNCSLLDDENYINEMKLNVPAWRKEGQTELSNKRAVWDWIKYNIRSHAISYSKNRSKERKAVETKLQNDYFNANKDFESDPNELNKTRLNELKEKLELYYDEKTRGVIIRARARWYEHGERSSKYFLNLEKRNHVKKHIRKLQVNGSLTTDPSTILLEQKHFYMNLYQSRSKDAEKERSIGDFLKNMEIPKLSEEQKQKCEGKISLQECETILNNFRDNKSPGNDGIPIEFYKCCWDLVKEPFLECVNESFEKGEMSNTQKQAVITLIEKKGKDRCFIENWRPISLLNVDAKIMAKVIATRIKNVLPNVIHCNQSGYVKDRYIGRP